MRKRLKKVLMVLVAGIIFCGAVGCEAMGCRGAAPDRGADVEDAGGRGGRDVDD
jgi:hypothetical protein